MEQTKKTKLQSYTQHIQRVITQEIFVIIAVMAVLAVCVSIMLAWLNAKNQTQNRLNAYEKQVDNYIANVKGLAQGFALSIENSAVTTYEEQVEMAGLVTQSDSGIGAAYFAQPDDTLTYYSAEDGEMLLGSETAWSERSWYLGAVEADGEVFVSDPYIDAVTGAVCITISREVEADGTTLGVVGIDFYIDEIVELISSADVGSGYLILAGADGTVMVHPNDAYEMTADESPNMAEVGNGRYKSLYTKAGKIHTLMDYKGGLKLAMSSKSDVSGWYLVMVEPVFSVYEGVILLILLIIVVGVAANIIVKRKTRKDCKQWFQPIEAVSALVPELAQGNLGVVFDEEKNISEVYALSKSLNSTVKQLKRYIQDIEHVVEGIAQYDLQVTSQTEYRGDFLQIQQGLNAILEKLNDIFYQIDQRADALVSYADQIQQSAEMVAQGATEQATSVVDLKKDMETFGQQIDAIVENADTMVKGVKTTNESLTNGERQMQDLKQAMDVIEKTTNEIDNIMQTITQIADQTDLLSLNASIEAARAGEAGKGFGVVAEEINKLAAECADASESIGTLVNSSREAVGNGICMVQNAAAAFEEGKASSENSLQNVARVQAAVSTQKSSVEEIESIVNEITKVVETNAAVAQENAASGTELTNCADELKNYVAMFQLKKQ